MIQNVSPLSPCLNNTCISQINQYLGAANYFQNHLIFWQKIALHEFAELETSLFSISHGLFDVSKEADI